METTTYKDVCKSIGLEFVEKVTDPRELKDNEYYALMIDDIEKNPHAIGKDLYNNMYLIGVQSCSDGRPYISKEFTKVHDYHRGTTMIVKTNNIDNFRLI